MKNKKSFTGFLKRHRITIISTGVGMVITFLALTLDLTGYALIVPNGIPVDQAYGYAKKHTDHLIKDPRTRTHGIWYDTSTIRSYTDSLRQFMNSKNTPGTIAGYSWKIGIFYGGGALADGSKRMLTMFIPIQVQIDSPYHVIDIFEAREHHDKKGDSTKIFNGSPITFWVYYEKYYKKYDKKKAAGDSSLVFDSGNMFP